MADKKAATGGPEPGTQPVIDLLTSILNEVQRQVQNNTPKPLEGEAARAVEQFKEVVAALALQPTITLSAEPTEFIDIVEPGTARLTWSSTGAQAVSIDKVVKGVKTSLGNVEPAAGGSINVLVSETTKFTATATSPCASKTADVTVTVISR